jgi:hypothetical protein
VYGHDRYYQIQDDNDSAVHGIYILTTNNEPLMSAIQHVTNTVVIPQAQMDTARSRAGTPISQLDIIQHQNLNNVVVAETLFGRPHPYGNVEERSEYSGILHYHEISLNNMLRAFAQFGIMNVNVLDRSCRVVSTGRRYNPDTLVQPSMLRGISLEEQRLGRLAVHGIGGKNKSRKMKKTIKLKRLFKRRTIKLKRLVKRRTIKLK